MALAHVSSECNLLAVLSYNYEIIGKDYIILIWGDEDVKNMFLKHNGNNFIDVYVDNGLQPLFLLIVVA